MFLLDYSHVDVSYDGVPVVRDFCARVEPGEMLGIVGPSGCGKSSLLRAAMGLLGPTGMVTRGRILYRGADLVEMAPAELRRLRGPELAMVFQDCLAALTPTRTIGAQLVESVAAHGPVRRTDVEQRACDLLERVNVADPRRILASYPFELSGGLGQRVGIVMAMIMEPAVLFADEPTSALDAVTQVAVVRELEQLAAACSTAVVLVTHNVPLALSHCGQVIELETDREGKR